MANVPLRGNSSMGEDGFRIGQRTWTGTDGTIGFQPEPGDLSLSASPRCRARRTKTPDGTCGFIKTCNLANYCVHCSGDDQLCNARAALDGEGTGAVIYKDDL